MGFVLLIGVLSFAIGFVFRDVLRRAFPSILRKGLKVVSFGPSSTYNGRPKDIYQRYHDLVWELYCPCDDPEMEIIFFPGLGLDGDLDEAFWKTWVAKDNEKVVWPKDWLSVMFPNARILSISYDCGDDEEPHSNVFALAEQLVNEIILEPNVLDLRCPVFLVGHSLGGLIIKHLIVSAVKLQKELGNSNEADSINAFMENLKGVFYYGTPHLGSRIADLPHGLPHTDSLMKLLTTLNSEAPRIGESFRRIRRAYDVRVFAMVEGRETHFKKFYSCWRSSVKVVDATSAQCGADDWYVHPTRDHFTVCRAKSPDDPVIRELARFIVEVLNHERHESESGRFGQVRGYEKCNRYTLFSE